MGRDTEFDLLILDIGLPRRRLRGLRALRARGERIPC